MHSSKHIPLTKRTLILTILVAVVAVCGMLSASADSLYYISDNGKVSRHYTSSTNPEDILAELGLELGIDDTYTITESDGYPEINIQRIQYITIDNGGQILRTSSYGETVQELLQRNHLTWDEDDVISEPLDAETYDGMELSISRTTYATESYARTMPFETVRREDENLPEGLEKIVTAGSDGEVLVTERVTYANGQETARELISEEVSRESVDQVVVVGTMPAEQAEGKLSIGDGVIVTPEGDVLTYTRRKTMTATAYTCEATGGVGITATGTPARVGAIAVDPKVIPYGTRMYILTQDGYAIYGIATAEDTGHPDFICGNRIDLYYDTEAECVQFGVRKCDVYILG